MKRNFSDSTNIYLFTPPSSLVHGQSHGKEMTGTLRFLLFLALYCQPKIESRFVLLPAAVGGRGHSFGIKFE